MKLCENMGQGSNGDTTSSMDRVCYADTNKRPRGGKVSVKRSATEQFNIFFSESTRKKIRLFKAANIRLHISFHASYKILVLSFSVYLHYILHMMFCTVKLNTLKNIF